MKLIDQLSKVFENLSDSFVINAPPKNDPRSYDWYWAFDEDEGILYQVYYFSEDSFLSPAEIVAKELS